MTRPQVAGRLAVVEEQDRLLVVREDDPDDWLCAFARTEGFPARRWAEDMVRTWNARVERGAVTGTTPERSRPGAVTDRPPSST